MIRIFAALFAAFIALPLWALDVSSMSEPEREAFRAEIRAYLLDNPEVLMEAIAVLEAREAEARAAADTAMIADNSEALFASPTDWVGGNPDGDIMLVEFLDYRCGYCKRAHPEVAALMESDGDIRLIVKEYPILGEQSVLAARFALGVKLTQGDDAYKAVQDALMAMRADVSETSLERLATGLGLDATAALEEMNSDAVTAILRANQELGRTLNITGTPTFIMNDQMLRGYMPLADMQTLVAEVRAE